MCGWGAAYTPADTREGGGGLVGGGGVGGGGVLEGRRCLHCCRYVGLGVGQGVEMLDVGAGVRGWKHDQQPGGTQEATCTAAGMKPGGGDLGDGGACECECGRVMRWRHGQQVLEYVTGLLVCMTAVVCGFVYVQEYLSMF